MVREKTRQHPHSCKIEVRENPAKRSWKVVEAKEKGGGVKIEARRDRASRIRGKK